jgi:voltage-gated potassium channel
MTALLTMLVMVGSSILMLHVEREAGNIKDGYDALWWSLTTVTTVGYGDRYPVTHAGRMVAGVLMGLGIALYATFTAFISSKIMSLQERRAETEREAIHEEVKKLREEVSALTAALRDRSATHPPSGDEKQG